MGAASYAQSSFLGGKWSPAYQGRFDHPRYRSALSTCLNGLTIEEGSWARRSGTRFCATTRNGQPGRLLAFPFEAGIPYQLELTNRFLRVFNGTSLVFNPDAVSISDISTANPAVVTLASDVDTDVWVDGTQVQVLFANGSATASGAVLRNRQFSIVETTPYDGTAFLLRDPITGLYVGAAGPGVDWDNTVVFAQLARIVELDTPYYGTTWSGVNVAQDQNQTVLLEGRFAPQVLTATADTRGANVTAFDLDAADFTDGPYLDAITDGYTITPSALTGTITLTASNVAFMDGGFVANDVGRMIRLYSKPAEWAVGTAYVADNPVEFDGAFYVALQATTGDQPDISPNIWAPTDASTVALWTWATIATVTSTTVVTATIHGDDLLYSAAIHIWRLGVYSNHTGWPTCGVFHEGRLWLAGSVENRVDGSQSNDPFNMAPTAPDGTVADNNAISLIFNADDKNKVVWMVSTDDGIICGTNAGEWIIHASNLNDPLTPTSSQPHRVTVYGCAAVPPVHTGFTLLFVQRHEQAIMEFFTDNFSQRKTALNISLTVKDLMNDGIAEIAHQEENVPILWARTKTGTLLGATYRRIMTGATEEPSFVAWHEHELGSGRVVESISIGPAPQGNVDALSMVTNDPATGIRHVEILVHYFNSNAAYEESWFVDDAVTASYAATDSEGGLDGILFYGLWHLNDKEVAVSVGGYDIGNFTVTSGQVFVPYETASDAIFTLAFWTAALAAEQEFRGFANYMDNTMATTPDYTAANGTVEKVYYSGSAGPETTDVFPDWPNNRVYLVDVGHSATLSRIWAVNLEHFQQNNATTVGILLAGENTGNNYFNLPMAVGPGGELYWYSTVGYSVGAIRKAKPKAGSNTGFDLLGTFGTYSNSASVASPLGVPPPESLAVATVDDVDFLVGVSLTSGNLWVINATDMRWGGHSFQIDEETVHFCHGTGPDANVVYALGADDGSDIVRTSLYKTVVSSGAADYSTVNIWSSGTTYATDDMVFNVADGNYYKSQVDANSANQPDTHPTEWGDAINGVNPAIHTERVAFIVPTDIDAAWADFNVYGPGYDETDGNLIAHFKSDGTTNNYYIVKIRAADGVIMWKYHVLTTQTSFQPQSGLNQGRIAGGVYSFLIATSLVDGSSHTYFPCYRLNTSDGSLVGGAAEKVYGLGNDTGGQLIDAYTGTMIINANYTKSSYGPSAPQPEGDHGHGVTPDGPVSNIWFLYRPETNFVGLIPNIQETVYPGLIGFPYTSKGQILRPASPQESGAVTGSALAKTRRSHYLGTLLHKVVTGEVQFGTDFNNMRAAYFKSPSQVPYTKLQLFSGVQRLNVDDGYSYDSQLCWQSTRTYPLAVLAIGGFLQTQDV